jgi:hypothetical protein
MSEVSSTCVAVIVADPGATVVITPSVETVEIVASDVDHVGVSTRSPTSSLTCTVRVPRKAA